jgi:hypothetical protein
MNGKRFMDEKVRRRYENTSRAMMMEAVAHGM